MKHSSHCVNLRTDELVALAGSLLTNPLAVPQSLTDLVAHMPAAPAAKPGSTTLKSAISATATTVTIAPALPNLVAGDWISIETEHCFVRAVDPTGTVLTVIRGVGSVAPAAHAGSAAVTFAQPVAADRVRTIIAVAMMSRSDQSSTYVWPFQATPPNFAQKPNQIGGASAIGQTSEAPGEVVPPAPYTLPDPAPPASVPSGVQGDE